MKKFIFAFLLVNMLIFPAYSKTCVKDYGGSDSCVNTSDTTDVAGSCETLGYFKTEVEGCTKYILCPFNADYKACATKEENAFDCSAKGFTEEDKSSWCDPNSIIKCPEAPELTACTRFKSFGCENLGFTEEDKSAWCPKEQLVVCPSDEKYTFCVAKKLNCADLGFTDTDKSKWCKSIVECENDSSLTLCSDPCEYASEDACTSVPGNNCEQSGESGEGCWFVTSCDVGYEMAGNNCKPAQCGFGETELTEDICATRNDFGSKIGIRVEETGILSGENQCKVCICEPTETECQYTNTDNDYEILSDQCCDGNYNSCEKDTEKLNGIGDVANAKSYKIKEVEVCGDIKQVKIGVETCDSGYCVESGSECKKVCPAEYKFNQSNLPAHATGTTDSPCTGLKYQSGTNCTNTDYTAWFKALVCEAEYKFDKTKGECVSTCTYQYDTAHYPNVKRTDLNDSCVRDGVTYYRDICAGVAESTCTGSQECFTETCTAYNGVGYGTCTKGAPCPKTNIQTSVALYTSNAQAVYKKATFEYTAELYEGSTLLDEEYFSMQFDAYNSNHTESDTRVLGSVNAGTYIYRAGSYSFNSYNTSAGCSASILGVVISYPDYGSACYTNHDPSSTFGLMNISSCLSNKKSLPSDGKIEFEVRKSVVPTITAIYSANCYN